MGDFQSSLPLWAWRVLEVHDLSFSLGKGDKINKLCLSRKLYQYLNVPFHQIHYSYCNKGQEHVTFIKFLWEVSSRSEIMLPNCLLFLFGKQKGTWSWVLPQMRWGNVMPGPLFLLQVNAGSEPPLTKSLLYPSGQLQPEDQDKAAICCNPPVGRELKAI